MDFTALLGKELVDRNARSDRGAALLGEEWGYREIGANCGYLFRVLIRVGWPGFVYPRPPGKA